MTRSKGVGRGRAAGSRRALRQANAERQRRARQAKTAPHAPDGKPTARPHLQPFQTPEHMAELRRRRAEKRPAAVAARQALEKRTSPEPAHHDSDGIAVARRIASEDTHSPPFFPSDGLVVTSGRHRTAVRHRAVVHGAPGFQRVAASRAGDHALGDHNVW